MIGINILILLMMKSRGKERLVISQSQFEKCSWVATWMLSIPELCCLLSHCRAMAWALGRNRVWMKRQDHSNPNNALPPMRAGTMSDPPNPSELDSLKVHRRHSHIRSVTELHDPIWLSQWPWEEARKGIIIFIYDYFTWITGDISPSQSDLNRFLSCCSFNCCGNNLPVKADIRRSRDHFLYVRVPSVMV